MATTLFGTAGASVVLRDGTIVEAATDGGLTLTLTAAAPPPSTAVATIAGFTFGGASVTFAVPSGISALALAVRDHVPGVIDDTEDVYLIGQRGGSVSSLLVVHYRRSLAGAWSEVGRRSASLPASASAINSLAASYSRQAGGAGLSTVLVLGRRDQPRSAAGVFYATIDPRAISDPMLPLFVTSGEAPSWLPALSPTSNTPLPPVDIARVGQNRPIFVDQEAVVMVRDGVVSSTWAPNPGVTTSFTAPQARVVGLDGDSYAVLTPGTTTIQVVIRGINGTMLARRIASLSDVLGGALEAKWDAVYNPTADELLIYYIGSATRTVRRIAIPLSTVIVGAAQTVTSTAGTGGTLSVLRVQRGDVDERRIRIALAQTLSGVESTQYVSDTSRNVAPLAPALNGPAGTVDAAYPLTLGWTFYDPNRLDRQSAYDLQVQRVSDSVNVVSVANVASATSEHTVAGGTLVNGVAYRYRVRTKDASGVYGAWSGYSSTITPQSFGSVTITSPASDDPSGLNTATVNVKWVGLVPGSEPTGWGLYVFDAVTDEQLSAHGSYLTYRSSFDVPVPTDRRVRIEVQVTSSAGTSPAAIRYLTSSYSRPTATGPDLGAGPSGSGVRVSWAVPPPAGSSPPAVLWIVERLEQGATTFSPVYSLSTPGGLPVGTSLYVDDLEVKSGVAYEYQLRAVASGGASRVGSSGGIVAPQLMGAWVHHVADPVGTLQHFPYAEGRKIERSVESETVGLIGRADPVIEYGDNERAELGMGIRIPHGPGDDARVEWWRAALRARGTLCYRDNRQRLTYCAVQGFTEADTADGTVIDVNLVRVPYVRKPTDATA